MSKEEEICELIGNKMTACRWDVYTDTHCTVRLELLSDARQMLESHIIRIRDTDVKMSTSTDRNYYVCNQECFELMANEFLFKINEKKLNAKHIQLLNDIKPSSVNRLFQLRQSTF